METSQSMEAEMGTGFVELGLGLLPLKPIQVWRSLLDLSRRVSSPCNCWWRRLSVGKVELGELATGGAWRPLPLSTAWI